jgi:predicted metal-dependent hydrolase
LIVSEFILDGRPLSYVVRRGRSRRRAYLRFNESLDLEVILPRSCDSSANEILEKSRSWIRKRHTELTPIRDCMTSGKMMHWGTARYLSIMPAEDGVSEVAVSADSIVLQLAAGRDARTELRTWMMKEAATYVNGCLPSLADGLGVEYGRVLVRDVKSRWGSCSRKKNLGFNYRLMMLPPDVAEYLLVHELAHIREFNHSKRFWETVAAACPNYREKEKKLSGYPPGLELSFPPLA